jgi:hypothetical protein
VIFTCRKILRHGTSRFASTRKEGVLQIIALKNPLPRPSLNARTLDPMADPFILKNPVSDCGPKLRILSSSSTRQIRTERNTGGKQRCGQFLTPFRGGILPSRPVHDPAKLTHDYDFRGYVA